ncbi:hypothetical protein BLOT_016414 [Blomia tropicalis]|nr:hypothetical protein BLOT_016414 [Blomia tropicalis]
MSDSKSVPTTSSKPDVEINEINVEEFDESFEIEMKKRLKWEKRKQDRLDMIALLDSQLIIEKLSTTSSRVSVKFKFQTIEQRKGYPRIYYQCDLTIGFDKGRELKSFIGTGLSHRMAKFAACKMATLHLDQIQMIRINNDLTFDQYLNMKYNDPKIEINYIK